jgi:hypothetical protein
VDATIGSLNFGGQKDLSWLKRRIETARQPEARECFGSRLDERPGAG